MKNSDYPCNAGRRLITSNSFENCLRMREWDFNFGVTLDKYERRSRKSSPNRDCVRRSRRLLLCIFARCKLQAPARNVGRYSPKVQRGRCYGRRAPVKHTIVCEISEIGQVRGMTRCETMTSFFRFCEATKLSPTAEEIASILLPHQHSTRRHNLQNLRIYILLERLSGLSPREITKIFTILQISKVT